jgi:phosphatidate cytidylyltransferase
MLQRTLTAIVFAAVMLGGIFGGKHSFFALFAVITAGCLWELYGLVFPPDAHRNIRRVLGVVWGLAPYVLLGGSALELLEGSMAFAGLVLLVFTAVPFFILELFLNPDRPFDFVGRYALGVFYITLPFCLLVYLSVPLGEFFSVGDYNPQRVIGLLGLVWVNDTMAYLVGSQLGKNKLFERISPKKTWEGFLGGGICAVLVAWGIAQYSDAFTPTQWMLLAATAAVFGTLGDLVESMLKRSLGIKDSGNLLPGHGGLLDRFDAFIIALPFYWLVLILA